jgi:hypothetical protein
MDITKLNLLCFIYILKHSVQRAFKWCVLLVEYDKTQLHSNIVLLQNPFEYCLLPENTFFSVYAFMTLLQLSFMWLMVKYEQSCIYHSCLCS